MVYAMFFNTQITLKEHGENYMCYDDQARPPIPPGTAGAASDEDLVLTASDGNRFAAYHI